MSTNFFATAGSQTLDVPGLSLSTGSDASPFSQAFDGGGGSGGGDGGSESMAELLRRQLFGNGTTDLVRQDEKPVEVTPLSADAYTSTDSGLA